MNSITMEDIKMVISELNNDNNDNEEILNLKEKIELLTKEVTRLENQQKNNKILCKEVITYDLSFIRNNKLLDIKLLKNKDNSLYSKLYIEIEGREKERIFFMYGEEDNIYSYDFDLLVIGDMQDIYNTYITKVKKLNISYSKVNNNQEIYLLITNELNKSVILKFSNLSRVYNDYELEKRKLQIEEEQEQLTEVMDYEELEDDKYIYRCLNCFDLNLYTPKWGNVGKYNNGVGDFKYSENLNAFICCCCGQEPVKILKSEYN